MPVEKKSNASSATCEGPPAADRLVINLTSSKGQKYEAVISKLVTPAMQKVTSTIVDKIIQRRGSVVPLVSKSMPKRPLGAKSSSLSERFFIMKSDKVNSAAKVAPRPIPLAAKTGSPL
ncbi:hypothetical protein ACFX2C_006820 [Malus domestica]